jgi:hypothetical protein
MRFAFRRRRATGVPCEVAMKTHTSIMFLAAVFSVGCGSSNTDINPAPTDGGSDATKDSTANDAQPETATEGGADTTSVDGDAGDASADGDTSAACLPTSGPDGLDTYLTLMDATKCVVAQYDVEAAPIMTLTWGRHGGPLGFDASDPANPKVVRWKAPAGATGALAKTEETHAISKLPSGSYFWGTQALDLPFFGWTAISYTTTATASAGELLLVTSPSGDAVDRYNVNGFFSENVVGTSDGRLFYTGLSEISRSTTTTNAGGLYFADSCGTAASRPRLVPEGDATCTASTLYSTWQAGTSGSVAIDARGDLFAILSTFGGSEEMRGFHHASTARGAAVTAGAPLFTDANYTSEMAADGAKVYFQPNDPSVPFPTPPGLDVEAIAYSVDDTAKTITASGSASKFLKLVKPGTAVALLVDDAKRLWVGVAKATTGDAGPTSSTFYVLADKH